MSRANIELADDISEKVIYEIASYASHTSQITPILNLSDFDRFELTAKINSLLAYDTNRVKEATDDIKASLKCVKRIRKKMERSSIENYDDCKAQIAGLLVASEARRLGIDTQSPKLEQIMLQYISNNDVWRMSLFANPKQSAIVRIARMS